MQQKSLMISSLGAFSFLYYEPKNEVVEDLDHKSVSQTWLPAK